jgi:CBS domain-containing protein
MNASDVMTQPVITITPDASVIEIARLLAQKNISAVPVVDGVGAMVGIVTEGDLLRRRELGTERHRHPIAALVVMNRVLEEEYVRSHASRAEDIMRRNVICAAPDASLSEVVDLLEKHGVKRVPIVEGGKVVGIVSRADLIRALAAIEPASAPAHVSDRKIRRQLIKELSRHDWSRYHGNKVTVGHGIVHFWGLVQSAAEVEALRVAAETIPGVRGVRDHTVMIPTPIA